MKKSTLMIFILAVTLPIAFSQVGNPNTECQNNGFEYGVAKFECGSSSASDGNGNSFTVTWSEGCNNVQWTSNTAITGVVSKEGTNSYVSDGGTSGTINSNGMAISHITFCVNLETEVPINFDERCEYYCPDPDYSSGDYWNITTTNQWCFQNGHVCEAASNYAGCVDVRHGTSGNRYWCSECRCEDVNDCDAPGRCVNNQPLPTCPSVGQLDCNGVPTYKDPRFGGNGCPTGCEPGPSCDGICACSNAIEFAYCCQEIPIICGDGKCNLEEETCEFVNGEGKLCTTQDEGKAPTGDETECRQPGHSKECTTCGDGVWQRNMEECDYACTPESCPNGGYNPECTLECKMQLPFTELFCVKLTMGGSACIERWATNLVCNFNNVGQSQGKVDELDLLSLTNKIGSTNNVDLAIYDMDSDRDIDNEDLEICTAFFNGNS